MKIAVCSDIHLEFGDIDLKNTDGADVLILGGDIMVAADVGRPDPNNFLEGAKSNRYKEFIDRCAQEFPQVIFIMGNHEHYHGDFALSPHKLRAICDQHDNVHFLDKEVVHIQDVMFFGGTLWTDMNNEDPETLSAIKYMMNDFRCVDNGTKQRRVPLYKKGPDGQYIINEKTGGYVEDGFKFKDEPGQFSPQAAVEDHKQFLTKLETAIAASPDVQVVVCGHHSPSKTSTHIRYQHETLMNGGYSSNLDQFIIDHPQIKLWTHGHTHEDFDYMIGQTRIVCNPRGYHNYEARADQFQLKFVDI
jgi:Icc-related predicted phosphoesterase